MTDDVVGRTGAVVRNKITPRSRGGAARLSGGQRAAPPYCTSPPPSSQLQYQYGAQARRRPSQPQPRTHKRRSLRPALLAETNPILPVMLRAICWRAETR